VSLDGRLNRLTPGLSAKERAILILRSTRQGTPEDPQIRLSMPREQSAEFNRLIVLMNACNIYLPLYITVVEHRAEQLCIRLAWIHSLTALGMQAFRLAELLPVSKRPRAEEVIDRWPLLELPWDPEERDLSWLNIAEQMTKGLRAQLVYLWEELRSIESVLDEVAQEFDGEDPLRPIMRDVLDTTRKKLTDLHAALSESEPLELKEPDEEEMELARAYFENGRRLMERI
jgi:hypothetical protein